MTRDTNGFAVKATWAQVNGRERMLFKDPKTDDGVKRSARGRLAVLQTAGGLQLVDGLTKSQQASYGEENLLRPVWEDGRFVHRLHTLDEIRARVAAS